MIRQLLDALPPVIRNVREYQVIMDGGEQAEISNLWDAVDAALKDQFVTTATANGVRRLERILGIKPKGTDSLEARKFRILSRLNEQLPYTVTALENMLATLCGADGFSVDVQNATYALHVKVALTAKSNFDDVETMLHKVVPANIVIELALMYNQWGSVRHLTWQALRTKTWREVKEEVL